LEYAPPPLEGTSADVILKGVGVMKKEEVKGGDANEKVEGKDKTKRKADGKNKGK
jgi:sortase (surface protein transpeptidase)